MPDPLFADLYRETEHLSWAPTEQVRRRGRQRTRRTRIAAGLACVVAVAVVATGAAALAGRPDAAPPIPPATESPAPAPPPSTGPSRTATPTPTGPSGAATPSQTPTGPVGTPSTSNSRPSTDSSIPAAAMLQLADLPTGFRAMGNDLDGDWSLESVTIYCRDRSPLITVGEVARRGAVFDSPTDGIIQRVTRHSGGNAATSMDRVSQLVTGCVPYREGDSLSILGTGLGGDESLLVGSLIEGQPSRWLFVRQGDLVAQVSLDSATTPTEARRYAHAVAERLCAGTDAC